MILIIGGAYQGKLDYAKEAYQLGDEDIFICSSETTEIDPDKKAICHLELFIYALLKRGLSPASRLEANLPLFEDKIVICDDISGGVVATDPLLRQWREETGRALILLAKHSESVIRVFCGIATQIK